MTDGHPTHDDRPRERRFDDDRLLAFALGLDDDPELAAAAAGDERLRRRLDAMSAEIGGVATQLDAAVPAPGGDYADPTGVRWAGLREFYQPPAPPRRQSSRWLRILAPVTAVAIALAVGAGIIWNVNDGSDTTAGDGAETTAERQSSGSPAKASLPTVLAARAEGFAVVVLARAQDVTGEIQQFAVVRALKGHAPSVLRLGLGRQPAEVDRLHVLFLRPQEGVSLGNDTGGSSTPGPSAAVTDQLFAGEIDLAFTYAGQPAVAAEVPDGADPAVLRLP